MTPTGFIRRPSALFRYLRACCCDSPLLGLGTAIWVLSMALWWPEGLSFADEVGYLGETKLLLAGHLLPRLSDPGMWASTPHGLVPQYPLLLSALLVPFLAVTPRAVFVLGVLSGIGLCWLAARILKGWGTNPAWALLVLMHPTVALMVRTTTADVLLAALALGSWLALTGNRRVVTAFAFAGMFAIKATGMLLGACLVGGEILSMITTPRLSSAETKSRLVTCAVALAAGFLSIFVANEISARQLWFAYDLSYLGTPPFWFSYLGRTAPAHLRTVLFLPPLLIAGAFPYWRRRAWGPLFVILGYGTLMCSYFFVDRGTSRLESLVLSPRLLLPVVVFLLVGYADLLAAGLRRFPLSDRVVGPLLIAGAASGAVAVGIAHRRWQAPMGMARRAAEQIVRRVGSNELGLAPQAVKAGLLFPGPTPVASIGNSEAAVVLCSDHSASYRAPDDGGNYNCSAPGYHSEYRSGGFEILVRTPSSAPGPRPTDPKR